MFNKTRRKYSTSRSGDRSNSGYRGERGGRSTNSRSEGSSERRDVRTWTSNKKDFLETPTRPERSESRSFGDSQERRPFNNRRGGSSRGGRSFGGRSSYGDRSSNSERSERSDSYDRNDSSESSLRSYGDRGGSFGRNSSRGGSSFGGRRSSGGFRSGGRGRSSGSRGGRFEGKKIGHEKYIAKAETLEQINSYVASTSFEEMDIDSTIKANIKEKGYTHPTEIQDKTIKHILAGKDVVGLASTGQGKTAAFLVPLMNKAITKNDTQVLVVVPTRELATQIYEEFRSLNKGTNLRAETIIGGASAYRQISGLRRNPQFVIGTPGRLKDLEDRRVLKLENFNTIVLDEVDRMLDMGFVDEIKALIAKLPSERQSLFLSATMDTPVEKIAHSLLRNPVTIELARTSPTKSVDQDIVRVGRDGSKIDKLVEIIESEPNQKILIFTKTKREADRVSDNLYARNLQVDAIHGDKSQYIRNKVISKFKTDQINILVATDVAARGLDIPDITLVINYDEPQSYEDYVHRIGRTGRYGKKGKALTFVG